MRVPLTKREIRTILHWADTGRDSMSFPAEEIVLRKLHRLALGDDTEGVDLSRAQMRVILGWAEINVSGHYGGGDILNIEESGILQKIRRAMTGKCRV